MLVLSRREDDKLVFPNIGITIKILKVAGRCVRVGVDAPKDVRVLRHEIADASLELSEEALTAKAVGMSAHRLRNRLNRLSIGLHLLRRQNEAALNTDAERTVRKLLAEFQALDDDLAPENQPSPPPTNPRALLVEDDENESELMAGFLRISGFDVDVASDGCDALDYLATQGQPHIVLLDMQMPRCDGPTTLSAIRENPDCEGLRVFGVSGREPEEVGVSVGPEGVDRWFTKPVNPQSLVKEIKRQIETARVIPESVCE